MAEGPMIAPIFKTAVWGVNDENERRMSDGERECI